MRLDTEFVRLPLRFDHERLAEEVAQFPEAAWRPHPQGEPGNTAIQLVARDGDPDDDATKGVMRPTPHLARCPYIQQVFATLDTVVGRTRLMRIEGGGDLDLHADTNHYWWEHLRVHVPITTRPDVVFHCGRRRAHLGAGEVWVFDTWRPHGVENPMDVARVHLVIDTVGSPALWDLIDRGERPFGHARHEPAPDRRVDFDPAARRELAFETVNRPLVMSPWEQRANAEAVFAELRSTPAKDPAAVDALEALVAPFEREWRALWARHGDAPDGWDRYDALTRDLDERLGALERRARLANGVDAVEALRQLVVRPAIDRERTAQQQRPAAARPASPARPGRRPRRIEQPVFIVSPPRSGSTLLFETLAQSPTAWTIGGESHQVIESVGKLSPAQRGYESNRLTASDADELVVSRLEEGFLARLRDRDGNRAPASGTVRLLEKTPKNALRVPFLAKAFPDATFVYLYRDPRETLSSMIDAWRSGRFVTYPRLPGWDGPPWSLLLTPGWQQLRGKELHHVVAHQWATTTNLLLDDLESLGADRWCVASYDRLISEPQAEMTRLCDFLQLDWDRELTAPLPNARHTLTSPEPDKWRRNAQEIRHAWPAVRDTARRAHAVFAQPPATRPGRRAASADASASRATLPATRGEDAFASVYTGELPRILTDLGSSLAVSTYQSGRLILVRMVEGKVNTHLRFFPSPMGIARSGRTLVLGTKRNVWEYRDQPAVASKVEPAGSHDACFLPRSCHVTGDISIHELAFVQGELWIVNTRFSCLSTLDREHSFVPRWRPSFVSALAAEDRCHLNGLAVRDDEVRYVTALGETDARGAWRENKVDGGIIIDVPSGEIVARGLSMPHSPRWYRGRLWVLESGKGEVNVIDPDSGASTTVARLPGFTRGLAFAGRYAFVGLSQVRETVFGGIPLAQRLADDDRRCGVWVLDIDTGTVAGFLRFEGAVQEIFDVQLLAGVRCPELAEPEAELVEGSFVLPDAALADVAAG